LFASVSLFLLIFAAHNLLRGSLGPQGPQGVPGPPGPPAKTEELTRELELALADRRLRQIEINLPKLTDNKKQIEEILSGMEKAITVPVYQPKGNFSPNLSPDLNMAKNTVSASCPDLSLNAFVEPTDEEIQHYAAPGESVIQDENGILRYRRISLKKTRVLKVIDACIDEMKSDKNYIAADIEATPLPRGAASRH
jgi:hypothetical protein